MAEGKSYNIGVVNTTQIVDLLDASVETIKKVSAAVIKLSSIDVESFIKSEKNLKKIIPGVQAFTAQIIDIIKMLSDDAILKGNEDELAKLFIDANTYLLNKDGSIKLDKNGQKTIIKNGFTIPSIIAAVASSITNMSKSMNELSNIGLDITSSIKFKISIMLFKEQLRGVIDTIADILDDETIKKTLFNSETNLQGTITVFEQLNDLFKVIDTYSSIKNLITVQLASWVTNGLYKDKDGKKSGLLVKVSIMLSSDTWTYLKDKKRQKEIDEVNKVFKGLLKIVENIKEIAEQATLITVLFIPAAIGLLLAHVLLWEVKFLVWDINKMSIVIEAKETDKSIVEIASILKGLADICLYASALILLAIPASIGLLLAHVVLWEVHLLVKTINKISLALEKEDAADNILKIVAIMGAIAGLCAISALTGLLVLKAWDLIFYGFLAITVMLLAIIGIMWILSHKSFQQMSVQSALTLLVLTGVLAALCIVVLLTAVVGMMVVKFWSEMLWGLLALGVALTILIGVFFLVNLASPVVMVGAIAMLILVGAILVLEIAVMMLVAMVAVLNTLTPVEVKSALDNLKMLLLGDKETKTEGLISTLCGCAGYIVEILGALIVLALITVVSVMLTVIVALFLTNAAMLNTLGEDGIKEAGKNIKLMINTFIDAIDIFAGKGLGGSAKLMAKITGAVIIFTELMIIAGCIAAMAAVIQHIAALDMEEFDENGHPTGKRVKMTESDIINAVNNIQLISSFFTELVTPGTHALGGFTFEGIDLDDLEKVSIESTAKMVDLMIIVSSIGQMAETIQKVASLSIPTGFDKNGKPTGYRQMTGADFTTATTNIGKIATLFVNSLAEKQETLGDKSILEYVSEFKKKEIKKLDAVFSIGDSISGMVDAVINVNEKLNGVDLKGTGQILGQVVSMMVNRGLEYVDRQGKWQPIADVMSQVNKNWKSVGKAGDLINNIVNNFTDKNINVEDHKKFIDENIKFLDKANSIDVDKIKTVTEMFGQMTSLSESLNGNIEDLAKTLSEDLVDALNKLNEAINGEGTGKEPTTPVGTSQAQDSKNNAPAKASEGAAKDNGKVNLAGVESKLQEIVNKLKSINSNIEELA